MSGLRVWFLITGGGGGGLQNRRRGGIKVLPLKKGGGVTFCHAEGGGG